MPAHPTFQEVRDLKETIKSLEEMLQRKEGSGRTWPETGNA
jgi:hypothetical protein